MATSPIDIREIVSTLLQQVRAASPPPPPPPALTAEQIENRVNASTSDPAQRQLLTEGYTRAQAENDGALWQQTEELSTLYRDREILALSRAIGPDDTVPAGWSRATEAQLAQYGLRPADLRPEGNGFNAELFIPDPEVFGPDALPVLQFEGTDFGDLNDVHADVAQAMGHEEAYYNSAIDIATRVNQTTGGEIVFSGHSLGGGLATAASLATGAEAVVSNPAGVHPDTVAAVLADRGLNYQQAGASVTTYVVDGDLLTELQAATDGLNEQNADTLAAIVNGLGHGLNAYQDLFPGERDRVEFPTDVTGQQVRDIPEAAGSVVTLDARNADGSARPDVVPLDRIVDDINARVDAMPLSDFGDFVADGASWVQNATSLFRDGANIVGGGLSWLGDRIPGPFGAPFSGAGSLVSGGGEVVGTVGDWIERGGELTRDFLEGVESVASMAISAADGSVRDSFVEMVDRHSFGVFDGAMASQIADQEQALRDQLG